MGLVLLAAQFRTGNLNPIVLLRVLVGRTRLRDANLVLVPVSAVFLYSLSVISFVPEGVFRRSFFLLPVTGMITDSSLQGIEPNSDGVDDLMFPAIFAGIFASGDSPYCSQSSGYLTSSATNLFSIYHCASFLDWFSFQDPDCAMHRQEVLKDIDLPKPLDHLSPGLI